MQKQEVRGAAGGRRGLGSANPVWQHLNNSNTSPAGLNPASGLG